MIVITTPTGQIGQEVLNLISSSSEDIRAIMRDPSRLPQRLIKRVEIIQGSHDDIDVLTHSLKGAESLLWLVPPNPRSDNPMSHYLDFTRPACEAIKQQGIKHVVGISSLGHAFGKNAGLLSPAFAMDELIMSTGVSYRSLLMPFFMENLLHQVQAIKNQGTFFMANSSDRILATCATHDIASMAARLLLDQSWTGQDSIPVVGPDDLSPEDMAQIMSHVLERPIRYHQVPRTEYVETMMQYGMSEAWATGLIDMVAAQDQGIYDTESRIAQRTSTSFMEWCEKVLKPAILM
ncbi:NmrA family NAD(P)-binding protein [Paenibacillus oryzisoli]|uniref:NmrA family transcriptional regulator n=1 Tax=Paenibacillus oryzisoli TaxID=1850517 RepID=A0A198A6N0_9BACL|nr:NmrA family NAD(P)-binding protein [Paenibacillus oryzisoli]OAS16760.1 NmrA family transcriptional regulator [Paenibacillus oryzisoli]